jgi:hypothetical protein
MFELFFLKGFISCHYVMILPLIHVMKQGHVLKFLSFLEIFEYLIHCLIVLSFFYSSIWQM